MPYEKPEVVMAVPACAVVQNHMKWNSIFIDTLNEETVGAYEVDE
jgi:hypothetical protein